MRRLIAAVTAVAFVAATPVFAQGTPPTASGPQTSQSNDQSIFQKDSLLLDGQDANAQQDPNQQDPNNLFGDIPTGVVVGLGAAGIGGIIYAVTRRHSTSP